MKMLKKKNPNVDEKSLFATEKNKQRRKLKDEHHGPIQIRVDR
jgi:hypothetical protein